MAGKRIGTKRQLANGKWELCVSNGKALDGKRIREYKCVDASGPREAEVLLAEFVTEVKSGGYEQGRKILLEDFAKKWIEDYAEKNTRDRTSGRYKTLMPRIVSALGHKKLGDIKPTHLLEFYNMLEEDGIRQDGKPGGLSKATIKHHHTLLSIMFSTAVQWQIIKENPCERVKPPKLTTREKIQKDKETAKQIYSIEQILQLIIALGQAEIKYRVLVMLAIFTGFRRSELMGLEWHDVDFINKTIDLKRSSLYTPEAGIYEDETKTAKSTRAVCLPKMIMDLLMEYRKWWNKQENKAKDKWIETNRLFTKWNGGAMHPDTISSWFPKFLENNKLPHMNFHKLRHLHMSILLMMGMDYESVADQGGYSTTQMLVNVYGHNVRKKNRQVAELLAESLLNTRKDPEQDPEEETTQKTS
jgi:integrase